MRVCLLASRVINVFHTHTTRPIAVRNLLRASSESPWIVPRAVPCIYSMQETMNPRNRSNSEKNDDDTREIVLQLYGDNTTHPEKLKKISSGDPFIFTRRGVLGLFGMADGHPTWTPAWTRMRREVPLFYIVRDQLVMQTKEESPASMAVFLNSRAKIEQLRHDSVHELHDNSVIVVCYQALTPDSTRHWHTLFTVTYRYRQENPFVIDHEQKPGQETPGKEESSRPKTKNVKYEIL